jgi:hypothetical protein
MRKKQVGAIAIKSFALLVVLGTAYQAMAQDATTPYPNMAPIEQYLMDRTAEIAMARSAAPESISRDAEIRVLGRHGYETAVKGKNDFVCMVERSWISPIDDPGFWNPKGRAPICFNAAAARTYLPRVIKKTELILAGSTKAQMIETITSAVEKKELPAMESAAMCYMLSKCLPGVKVINKRKHPFWRGVDSNRPIHLERVRFCSCDDKKGHNYDQDEKSYFEKHLLVLGKVHVPLRLAVA